MLGFTLDASCMIEVNVHVLKSSCGTPIKVMNCGLLMCINGKFKQNKKLVDEMQGVFLNMIWTNVVV